MPSCTEKLMEIQGVMFIRPEVIGLGNKYAEMRAVAPHLGEWAIMTKVDREQV